MDNTILKLHQVVATTAIPRSSLYKMIANGTFPEPIQLSQRSVGWLSSEVQNWIQSRIEFSRGTSSGSQPEMKSVSLSSEEGVRHD